MALSLPWAMQYVTAMRNATDARLWYSLGDLPLLLLPVVARVSRAETARRPPYGSVTRNQSQPTTESARTDPPLE